MLHPIEYINHIAKADKNRLLMSRIGLNALFDCDAYPVDLSELDKLSGLNLSIVYGFLNWCAVRKSEKYGWSQDHLDELIHIVKTQPAKLEP